jgi:UDP-3-O-[3-hydroxymyristoyl] glucosamine N-acyltransferase
MLGDPRFFHGRGPLTLADVAAAAGARLPDGAAGESMIRRPATLDAAGPDSVSFLENARYAEALASSRAGACLVRAADAPKAPPGMVALVCAQPYLAWARVLALFFPEPEMAEGSIDAGASVHPSAILGPGVRIAAGAVVSARAVLGRLSHRCSRLAQPRHPRRPCRDRPWRPHRPCRVRLRPGPCRLRERAAARPRPDRR